MSEQSRPADLWRHVGLTPPNYRHWCPGCGYYRVRGTGHRDDCTRDPDLFYGVGDE